MATFISVVGDVIGGSERAIRSIRIRGFYGLAMLSMAALSAATSEDDSFAAGIDWDALAAATAGVGLLQLFLCWWLAPRAVAACRIEIGPDEIRWHTWWRRRDRIIIRSEVLSCQLRAGKQQLQFYDGAGKRVGTVPVSVAGLPWHANGLGVGFDVGETAAPLRRHGWPVPRREDIVWGAWARWRRKAA
jgi:hypothetical protein